MASIVKRLRPRIVVPICVGSNPTTRPIFRYYMFDKFRSTISYKVVSYISYPSLFLYVFSLLKLEMLNIILVPFFLFFLFILLCIGVIIACIEKQKISNPNTSLLADIGFIIGWLIMASPFIYLLLCIINGYFQK